jgi:uncharacterized membrane protein
MPLHLFVVHFPVALFLVGAGADLLSAARNSTATRRMAGWRDRLEGPFGWANLAAALLASTLAIAITLSGTAISHGR